MDGPLLSHCMVDGKSAHRCSSRFSDNSMCRWRNSIGCADNPNASWRTRLVGVDRRSSHGTLRARKGQRSRERELHTDRGAIDFWRWTPAVVRRSSPGRLRWRDSLLQTAHVFRGHATRTFRRDVRQSSLTLPVGTATLTRGECGGGRHCRRCVLHEPPATAGHLRCGILRRDDSILGVLVQFAIVIGLLALVLTPSASAAQEAQRAAIATAADIAAALVKMGKQPHVNDAVIQISPFRVLVEHRNPGPQGANLHQNAAEVY